mgnify:CR=1 FL=1
MARTVSSLIAGRTREDAPGGTRDPEPGPARRDRCDGGPGRRHDLRRGLRRGSERAARLGRACRRPCAGARSSSSGAWSRTTPRRSRGIMTREIGKPIAEARGSVQEVVDTCNFFVSEGRRLYGHDRPVRAPGQAAVHVPQPGRRRGDRHGRELPGRRAVVVPGPGAPVRQRGRVEAGRVRARHLGGARPAVPARRLPDGVFNMVLADGASTFDGLVAGARRGAGRQGRVHGLERRRAAARRALRAPPADALSGARRQEPARRDARRRPRARGRGRAVQRVRHGGAAVHVAGHGDRARGRARRVPRAATRRPSRPRRSAIRSRTCSTGR